MVGATSIRLIDLDIFRGFKKRGDYLVEATKAPLDLARALRPL